MRGLRKKFGDKEAVAGIDLAGLGAALGLSNLFTAVLPYPMVERTGFPVLVNAQGYGAYRFGGVLGILAGTAVAATPVIIAVVQTVDRFGRVSGSA